MTSVLTVWYLGGHSYRLVTENLEEVTDFLDQDEWVTAYTVHT